MSSWTFLQCHSYSSLLNCWLQTKVYMDFGLDCCLLIVSILMLRKDVMARSPMGKGGAGLLDLLNAFFFGFAAITAGVPGPTPRSPMLAQAGFFCSLVLFFLLAKLLMFPLYIHSNSSG